MPDSLEIYLGYIDEIKSKAKDDGQKMDAESWDSSLKEAVRLYSVHRPFFVSKKIDGNDTNTYNLGTVLTDIWIIDYSVISEIEYPAGEVPPRILDSRLWYIYDDGTAQDGSNLKLIFNGIRPKTTEKINIKLRTERKLNEDTVNFPQTHEHFTNITTLGAHFACQRMAAIFAQSTDATISADVVNYHDKTRRYNGLAEEYLEAYNLSVFGTKNPEVSLSGAYNVKTVQGMSDSDTSGRYLFHRARPHGRV